MWVAAAVVGSAVVGAGASMYSSNKAASAQEEAAQTAARTTLTAQQRNRRTSRKQLRRDRRDLKPWLTAGKKAVNRLDKMVRSGPGEFEEDPGYQFRLDEGQKALERSASARGTLLSGASLKAAQRYGQDYASNEYGNFLDRYYDSLKPYQSLAGVGQTAAGTSGMYGQNYAMNMGQSGAQAAQYSGNQAINAGDARASGYINQGNTYANAANQMAYGLGNYYNNQPTTYQDVDLGASGRNY